MIFNQIEASDVLIRYKNNATTAAGGVFLCHQSAMDIPLYCNYKARALL
jgi:hypothetical protein